MATEQPVASALLTSDWEEKLDLSSTARWHSDDAHISLHLLTFGLSSVEDGSLAASLGHQHFDLSSGHSFEEHDPSFALFGFDLSSVMHGGSDIADALQLSLDLHSFCLSSIPVEGASETTAGTFSLGLQGFDFSSLRMGGASSTEKQGRQVVAVGLAHDFDVPSFAVGGPGVFEGGTLPNIFAVIAGRLSSLNRDGRSPPLRAALHGLVSVLWLASQCRAPEYCCIQRSVATRRGRHSRRRAASSGRWPGISGMIRFREFDHKRASVRGITFKNFNLFGYCSYTRSLCFWQWVGHASNVSLGHGPSTGRSATRRR